MYVHMCAVSVTRLSHMCTDLTTIRVGLGGGSLPSECGDELSMSNPTLVEDATQKGPDVDLAAKSPIRSSHESSASTSEVR